MDKAPQICPICNQTDINLSFQYCVDNFDIWYCKNCFSSFVWPIPSHAELKEIYNNYDWFEGGLKGGYKDYDEETKPTFSLVQDLLDSVGRNKTHKSLLDVGCGYGNHLILAAKQGWESFGVEISDHARNTAIKRHGQDIHVVETIQDLMPRSFELILLLDVIEHLPDPYQIFYELFSKGAIREHTTIVITTPNAKSLDALVNKKKWKYLHPPSHLVYYSAESLHYLLHKLRYTNITLSGLYKIPKSFSGENYFSFCDGHKNREYIRYNGLMAIASGSDFKDFMQERYVPKTWSVLAEYEHLPRYRLAQHYCKGKRVLDFGCGTGYGTKMLSEIADSVVGLDIDEGALEWARTNHKASNLEFIHSDTLGSELSDGHFDLIVCFEMIEHIEESLQKECLNQFRRIMSIDGLLIISTPNPEITCQYGENPFHLHEMGQKDFQTFLSESFQNINVLKQYIHPSVSIEGSSTKSFRELSFNNFGKEAAYIGFASNTNLPIIQGIDYFDRSFDFIGKWTNMTRRLEKLQTENYCNFLEKRKLIKEIGDINQVMVKRDEQLVSRDKQINSLSRTLDNTKSELDKTLKSKSWRLTKPLRFSYRYFIKIFKWKIPEIKNTIRWKISEIKNTIRWKISEIKNTIRWKISERISALSNENRIKLLTVKSIMFYFQIRKILLKDIKIKRGGKPRVLHIIGNFMTGGSSQLVCDIVEEMNDFSHEIITSFIPKKNAYPGFKARCLPPRFRLKLLKDFLNIYHPDIIHVHYWGAIDYDWYDVIFKWICQQDYRIIENINTPVSPYVSDKIDRYVYVSNYVKRTFGKDSPVEKSITIYPGSNFELFKNRHIDNIPDDHIGMVYRLEPDKLNEESIIPFIKVVKHRPQTKVTIVGGGSLLKHYKDTCIKAGVLQSFKFADYVPYLKLPDYYRQLSLFVAPVWRESFGQVSPFAMSMGLPVVGYDVGALSEIIGSKDLLAAPGDSDMLADIIIDLLEDRTRRFEICQYNQKRAHELFSVEKMQKAYRYLYNELMGL
jgi:2-polyprenyl-3-methyl-5-hydroxy-6-metoxy-1,4-benzoquinol methylase/glycosyltransferase involved in cell wall biosynthesis